MTCGGFESSLVLTETRPGTCGAKIQAENGLSVSPQALHHHCEPRYESTFILSGCAYLILTASLNRQPTGQACRMKISKLYMWNVVLCEQNEGFTVTLLQEAGRDAVNRGSLAVEQRFYFERYSFLRH